MNRNATAIRSPRSKEISFYQGGRNIILVEIKSKLIDTKKKHYKYLENLSENKFRIIKGDMYS